MTATEVSRGFSAALDRVSTGEEISIERGGRAVARLVGVAPERALSAEGLVELFADASRLDDRFAEDVATARAELADAVDPWAR